MLDLDLYNCALHIQKPVENTNGILRAGVLYIVVTALHPLGKTIDISGFNTCSNENLHIHSHKLLSGHLTIPKFGQKFESFLTSFNFMF